MRELDFARFHFYVKTGLYDVIKKANAHALQTATNIRYRRTMPLFTTYKITTKVRSFCKSFLICFKILTCFIFTCFEILKFVIFKTSIESYLALVVLFSLLLFLPLFRLQIVYWDEKTMYLEQQFISLTDGFIRAVVLSKQNVIGLNFCEVVSKMLGKDQSYRPEVLPELELWLSSMEKSSDRLKKKD